MIQSMTGYGKSVLQLPDKKVTVEIKSLNSKNIDLSVRTPSFYKEKELEIRKNIASKLLRGKVDFSIFVEMTAETTHNKINKSVVKHYISELQEFNENNTDLLTIAMQLPDSLKVEREELDENEWLQIAEGIDEAIEQIITYRTDEAISLETDFKLRVKNIEQQLKIVENLDTKRIEEIKTRLLKSIDELKLTVDENRFEQELMYYLEKLDITEEIVRLTNHLDYFSQELNNQESNGKKLNFITQEIGREINTIGSKANFAPMQQAVVQMKNELEKVKEQLLNVL